MCPLFCRVFRCWIRPWRFLCFCRKFHLECVVNDLRCQEVINSFYDLQRRASPPSLSHPMPILHWLDWGSGNASLSKWLVVDLMMRPSIEEMKNWDGVWWGLWQGWAGTTGNGVFQAAVDDPTLLYLFIFHTPPPSLNAGEITICICRMLVMGNEDSIEGSSKVMLLFSWHNWISWEERNKQLTDY